MRKIIILLLSSLILAAQPIIWKHDDFSNRWAVHTEIGNLETSPGTKLALWGFETKIKNTPEMYDITVTIQRDSWFFIEAGESLQMKLDDGILTLNGKGSSQSREVSHTGGIIEMASYEITLPQLKRIASSSNIIVRVSGGKGYITGSIPPGSKTIINQFLNEVPNRLAIGPPPLSKAFHVGIKFVPGPDCLYVVALDPGSPNQAILGKFIMAVEGERGSGQELQTKLGAAIARHPDGSSIKVTIARVPKDPEEETALALF